MKIVYILLLILVLLVAFLGTTSFIKHSSKKYDIVCFDFTGIQKHDEDFEQLSNLFE